MEISTIVILALTLEAIIEYGKLIFVNKMFNWKQVAAVVGGIGLALATGVDLFKVVGVNFVIPYIGTVLTGVIFSRGANYLSDFIKLIGGVATKASSADIEIAVDNPDEFIKKLNDAAGIATANDITEDKEG
jgi:hypothetical protein